LENAWRSAKKTFSKINLAFAVALHSGLLQPSLLHQPGNR
jgi:hypothetical protein